MSNNSPISAVAREPARGSGGQMPTRTGERCVALEECCLDHQRVGAAHRLDKAGELLGVADDGELAPGTGGPCTISGAIRRPSANTTERPA